MNQLTLPSLGDVARERPDAGTGAATAPASGRGGGPRSGPQPADRSAGRPGPEPEARPGGRAGSNPAVPRRRPATGSTPVALRRRRRFGADVVAHAVSTAAGGAVLLIIVAIGAFLVVQAIPALRADRADFFSYANWFPNDPAAPRFGIGALALGTLLSSAIALVLAVPVALGIALCLSHYAPRRLGTPLGFVIDLLAAVPSIVFGLWGRDYLIGPVQGLSAWLHRYLGWLPLFGSGGPYGKSLLLGGLVLAIMVLPIITALSREVFAQAPAATQEAALALGATRWEMIRTAVLPHGRPGLVAAVMLGLGRALGETIALALVLGSTFDISFDLIRNGGNSIAANIANQFGEAGTLGRGALIASGLVLFAITLVVNVTARGIIARRGRDLGGAR